MVELTVQQLINARKPMEDLLEVTMPAQTAFKLSRLVRLMNAEIETVSATIKALNEKYLDENGEPVTEEDGEKHKGEWEDLMSSTISIDYSPIDAGVLGGAPVKPGLFVTLNWVFKD